VDLEAFYVGHLKIQYNTIQYKCSQNDQSMTLWRPFCLCKLKGHQLKIRLGNRESQIQRTLIMLKSLVPNFHPKMYLKAYTSSFRENSSSLRHTVKWAVTRLLICLLFMMRLFSGMYKWSNHCLHHLLLSKRDTGHNLRHRGHSYQLVSYNFSSTRRCFIVRMLFDIL